MYGDVVTKVRKTSSKTCWGKSSLCCCGKEGLVSIGTIEATQNDDDFWIILKQSGKKVIGSLYQYRRLVLWLGRPFLNDWTAKNYRGFYKKGGNITVHRSTSINL